MFKTNSSIKERKFEDTTFLFNQENCLSINLNPTAYNIFQQLINSDNPLEKFLSSYNFQNDEEKKQAIIEFSVIKKYLLENKFIREVF